MRNRYSINSPIHKYNTTLLIVVVTMMGASCSGGSDAPVPGNARPEDEGPEGHGEPSGVRPPSTRLGLGSTGPEVAALYGYLKAYGYFPNDALLRHAGWRPAVSVDPADIQAYDHHFEAAVRRYQLNHGLEETGEVGDETLKWMQAPRCGFPDNVEYEPSQAGSPEVNEFVLSGCKWQQPGNVVYSFANYTADLTIQAQRAAVIAALNSWGAASAPLGFSEGAAAQINIQIGAHANDGTPFDGNGGVLAHAFQPCGGAWAGSVHFDDAETWSTATPPPAGMRDLQSVALHEVGHALGLKHSPIQQAVMYSTYAGVKRTLQQDDIAGLNAIYGGGCGCKTPANNNDPSLPFCNRVCNGKYTDWIDSCGIVQYQIDCSQSVSGGVCKYYASGSAYCTVP